MWRPRAADEKKPPHTLLHHTHAHAVILPSFRRARQRMASEARRDTWIDAVSGKHAAQHSERLLEQRGLLWRRDFGWVYDVWPEQPAAHALSGANGRCVLWVHTHMGFAADRMHAVDAHWHSVLLQNTVPKF